MKPLYAFIILAVMGGCSADKISPAEAALSTCETYAATLSTLADFRAADKLSDGQVKIVDQTVAYVGPYCKGEAPDVDAKLKDVAIDAGVTVLQSVVLSVIQ